MRRVFFNSTKALYECPYMNGNLSSIRFALEQRGGRVESLPSGSRAAKRILRGT